MCWLLNCKTANFLQSIDKLQLSCLDWFPPQGPPKHQLISNFRQSSPIKLGQKVTWNICLMNHPLGLVRMITWTAMWASYFQKFISRRQTRYTLQNDFIRLNWKKIFTLQSRRNIIHLYSKINTQEADIFFNSRDSCFSTHQTDYQSTMELHYA